MSTTIIVPGNAENSQPDALFEEIPRTPTLHEIDLDSHDVIGWNPVPTRWHPDRTGWAGGPYDCRFLPVIRPSLRFFQIAKVVYDTFPRRIWTFSSANLGLAIWEIYRSPAYNHNVYPAIEQRLQSAGLNGVEHYPCPAKTEGSFGKCHRRPCGMDSAVITCDGIITDPIDQIRCFMAPPRTPPFDHILAVYWDRLAAMYDLFLRHGLSLQRTRETKADKTSLVESCQQVVETIKAWCHDGCPLDWDLIHQAEDKPRDEEEDDTDSPVSDAHPTPKTWCPHTEPPVPLAEPIPETACPQQDDYPQCFYRADITAVAGSGQWVQYVKFLIENGFPTEDKFCEVVSTLALWFGFIEFFGENRQRTKDILRTYVLSRHNNKVTRLITGETQEVLEQINRIVDNVLDNEQVEGKELFARIRQKQSTGQYKHVYHFAPEIDADYSSSYTPNNQPLHLICGGLIKREFEAETHRDNDTDWRYEPDLTPLPEDVISRIKTAFKIEKRQLRKDTTTGRYPTLDAIMKLFNYLYSGRTTGRRRASQKLLVKMRFLSKSSQRIPIFRLLEKHRLIYKGSYLSTTKSRLWKLDKSVIGPMWKQRGGEEAVGA